MNDGSFYEGEFKDGEMTGSGVRKWAFNGNLYEGEFLKGEMNGKGLMTYGDGSMFEGNWSENKREGVSFLHDPFYLKINLLHDESDTTRAV